MGQVCRRFLQTDWKGANRDAAQAIFCDPSRALCTQRGSTAWKRFRVTWLATDCPSCLPASSE